MKESPTVFADTWGYDQTRYDGLTLRGLPAFENWPSAILMTRSLPS